MHGVFPGRRPAEGILHGLPDLQSGMNNARRSRLIRHAGRQVGRGRLIRRQGRRVAGDMKNNMPHPQNGEERLPQSIVPAWVMDSDGFDERLLQWKREYGDRAGIEPVVSKEPQPGGRFGGLHRKQQKQRRPGYPRRFAVPETPQVKIAIHILSGV